MGFLCVMGGIGKESMCIYIEIEVCGRLGLKVLRRRMKRLVITCQSGPWMIKEGWWRFGKVGEVFSGHSRGLVREHELDNC